MVRASGDIVVVSSDTTRQMGSGVQLSSLTDQLTTLTTAYNSLALWASGKDSADAAMQAAMTTLQGAVTTLQSTVAGLAPVDPIYSDSLPGTRVLVSTAAAANGWQIHATRRSWVTYSVTIQTTLSLTNGTGAYVVLEIAATNSSTAGDWKERARFTNSQAGSSLTIGLSVQQTIGAPLACMVPPGWFVRLRRVNISGTPTITLDSGQEVSG